MRLPKYLAYLVILYFIGSIGFSQYGKLTKLSNNQPIVVKQDTKNHAPIDEGSLIQNVIVNSINNSTLNTENIKMMKQLISRIPEAKSVNFLSGPILDDNITIRDMKSGNNKMVECGEVIEISYKEGQKPSESNIIYRLGSNTLALGLDDGVIGMKEGGIREISINDNQVVKLIEVTLLKIKTPEFHSKSELRLFEKTAGNGKITKCGSKAKIQYDITNLAGDKIYHSPIMEVTIGNAHMPFGILKAISYMKEGGTRTAILPPQYLKTIEGTSTNFFPETLPQHQMLVMDIDLLRE
jgi:FKBP-type peptidyl-prolyl cis-trans isomerase